jgi:spore germination protein Q
MIASTNVYESRPAYYGSGATPYAYGGGYGTPGAAPYTPAPAQGQPMQTMPMQTQGGTGYMMPQMPPQVPSGSYITPSGVNIVTVPQEESYIENILRLNRGKLATVYMTYENNSEWNAKVFKGVVEAAGRDHLILSDPATGMRYLLLTVNLDYVTFNEPIAYEYPFKGGLVTNQTPAGAAGR